MLERISKLSHHNNKATCTCNLQYMDSHVVAESEQWIVGMEGIGVRAGLGWFVVVLGGIGVGVGGKILYMVKQQKQVDLDCKCLGTCKRARG